MTLDSFWYIVLAVLWAGFLLLEGFDFGVGMLHGPVGRDEAGRRAAIHTIEPVWDGNEVWLIVAVAVTFAAFPTWYATMLSGFYPLFLVALVGLILRGVSFEFRSHATSERSRRIWSAALTASSLMIPLALGIVLGGLLGGIPIDPEQEFVGSFGDLFGPYALAVGVTITLVCLLHGAAYLALRTAGDLRLRALHAARLLGPVTAVAVLGFAAWTRIDSGHGVLLSVVELGAVLAAIAAVGLVHAGREGAALVATSATMLAVVASIFAELYPRVMVSSLGAANDLTVAGSVASPYALGVMTVVLAVLLPAVLAYQGWAYHVVRGRSRAEDVDEPPPATGGAPATAGRGIPIEPRQGPAARGAETVSWSVAWTSHPRFFVRALSWIAVLVVVRMRGQAERGRRAGHA